MSVGSRERAQRRGKVEKGSETRQESVIPEQGKGLKGELSLGKGERSQAIID